MTSLNFIGLLTVALVAVGAPLVAELIPRRLVPPVVLEVVAGIVLGPQVLGWLKVDGPIRILSLMGLGFVLFLAGMELTPRSLWNRSARLGLLAYAVAVAVAFPMALVIKAAGAHGDLRILALALTSTSLGVVAPVVRDAGQSGSPFGQSTLVAASIGEFASLLMFTILFSADPESTPVQVLYVALLGLIGAVAIVVIRWWWGSGWFRASLERLDETTSQLRVRSAFVLLLLFAALVSEFGLSSLLGAFVAGIVLRVANRDATEAVQERYLAKLSAIGFGFLVPVFFIATGAELDIRGVVDHAQTALLVLVILAGLVLARGLTSATLLGWELPRRGALALGAFEATSLTFPIVASTIGLDLHFLSPATAAALITAGLLSVVLFPAAAQLLRPWPGESPAPATPTGAPDPGC
jgi:Kef-type K+ transport system membrane component KefB